MTNDYTPSHIEVTENFTMEEIRTMISEAGGMEYDGRSEDADILFDYEGVDYVISARLFEKADVWGAWVALGYY